MSDLARRVDHLVSEVAGLRGQLQDLQRGSEHTRFILDVKACAKRAEELIALTTQAIEAVTAAEQAKAAAELRVAELDAREAAVATREDAVEQSERDHEEELKNLREARWLTRSRFINHPGGLVQEPDRPAPEPIAEPIFRPLTPSPTSSGRKSTRRGAEA